MNGDFLSPFLAQGQYRILLLQVTIVERGDRRQLQMLKTKQPLLYSVRIVICIPSCIVGGPRDNYLTLQRGALERGKRLNSC